MNTNWVKVLIQKFQNAKKKKKSLLRDRHVQFKQSSETAVCRCSSK